MPMDEASAAKNKGRDGFQCTNASDDVSVFLIRFTEFLHSAVHFHLTDFWSKWLRGKHISESLDINFS